MSSKPKKLKAKHFEAVKVFLQTHGKILPNKTSLKARYYKSGSISLILGEFMNGNGYYIESPTLLVIQYIKDGKIVKKRGYYKELEQYANDLESINKIRILLHKKTS